MQYFVCNTDDITYSIYGHTLLAHSLIRIGTCLATLCSVLVRTCGLSCG